MRSWRGGGNNSRPRLRPGGKLSISSGRRSRTRKNSKSRKESEFRNKSKKSRKDCVNSNTKNS